MKRSFLFIAVFIYGLVECVGQTDCNSLLSRGINPKTGVSFEFDDDRANTPKLSFLTGAPRFKTEQVVPNMNNAMCFQVHNGKLYVINDFDGSMECYDLKTNELIKSYPSSSSYSGYPSFITVSPDGQRIWAGFTQMPNGNNDKIYSIPVESGQWQLEATFPANFDMEFFGEQIFVSGVDMSINPNRHAIFLLDRSGANNHKKIIETGSHSGGLAIDNEGNIYFGTNYFAQDNFLYRWNAQDINNIINRNDGAFLTVTDAVKLTNLPAGAYDCDTDDEGNVFVSVNNFYPPLHNVLIWNGIEGEGNNYYLLGSTDDEYAWISTVKAKGNIYNHEEENGVYTFSYFQPVAKISKRSPFIAEVLEYTPAPGQFINESPWGLPTSPQTITGKMGTSSGVSLGAFGGYIIFKFDGAVENHLDNPYGIDFNIYGNAIRVDDMITWAEPGTVWVMKDENNNGLPDDTWYLLAGSDYWFSSTKKDYEVTYTNPNASVDVPWFDNYDNSDFIYVNGSHSQPYYPDNGYFPHINTSSYTLSGIHIEGNIYPYYGDIISRNRAFGFADNTPYSPHQPLQPHNPYIRNVYANGDGFDISWAIDENGEYVDLDVIHFVKVQTAILADGWGNGEISTELMGAVVIDPNPTISGVTEMVVIKDLPHEITETGYQLEVYTFNKGRISNKEIVWSTDNSAVTVDDNNILNINAAIMADVKITASLAHNPDIKDVVSVFIDYTSIKDNIKNRISIYPNPASDFISVKGIENATVTVFDMTGKELITSNNCNETTKININNLSRGVYFVCVENEGDKTVARFVKK